MTSEAADCLYMDLALALARAQLGRTAPNPAVGCVLVKDGKILASGATADGGRPHAERIALDRAGPAAAGATAYVTLEPCAHHGQTPPCALGLIDAGIARVVIACLDPFAKVDGRGMAMLQAAGVKVELGLREADARRLNAGFFHRIRTGRPMVHADARSQGYEARLAPLPLDELAEALDQLGQAGISRVRVDPDTDFAKVLEQNGLLASSPDSGHTVY